MTRNDVEHVIKAAAIIAKDKKVMVIGSNAIYGSVPVNDCNFYKSNEVDIVFFSNNDEKSLKVDGAIGEKSDFHMTHNYYAHGVSIDTATLPRGWQKRLSILYSEQMGHAKGYCISIEDLAASKLVAGRDKDFKFIEGLFEYNFTTPEKVKELLYKLPRKKEVALNNFEICKERYLDKSRGIDF